MSLNVDIAQIGSSGTIIGATLQSAGLYIQSYLLDHIQNGLGNSLALFLYTASMFVGITTWALTGEYKLAIWYLIGPPVFFLLINNRDPVELTKWQFGNRELQIHQDGTNIALLDGVKDDNYNSYCANTNNRQAPCVSSFYRLWDRMVSSTIQNFITILGVAEVKGELDFISKSERYTALFNAQTSDPDTQKFLRLVSLDPRCMKMIFLYKYLGDPRKVWSDAELYNPNLNSDPTSKKGLIQELELTPIETQSGSKKAYIDEIILTKKLDASLKRDLYTCKDLYSIALAALKKDAAEYLVTSTVRDTDVRETSGDRWNEVLKKWNQTKDERNLRSGERPNDTYNPNNPNYQPSDAERLEMVINTIAYSMLSKMVETQKGAYSDIMDSSIRRDEKGNSLKTQFNDEYNKGLGGIDQPIKIFNDSYEFENKGEFLSAMLALPYVQGFILFFLSVSFPLVCFVMLVPGRHAGFFIWMQLWIWIKLWDFGFAIVMVLDDLLYQLLPQGPFLVDKVADTDPTTAFKMLLGADPTYSVNTYYNIIATCIAAVPIVTGFIVKKGGEELISTAGSLVKSYGGKIGGSMSSAARANIATGLLGLSDRLKTQAAMNALNLDNLMKDKGFMDLVKERASMMGVNSLKSGIDSREAALKTIQSAFGSGDDAKIDAYFKSRISTRLNQIAGTAMIDYSRSNYAQGMGTQAIMYKWFSHDDTVKSPEIYASILEANAYRNPLLGQVVGTMKPADLMKKRLK